MNTLTALYRKELSVLFFSPVAYAIASVFVVLMAYTFCAQLFHTRSASLIAMLYQAASLLLLIVPILTMRQIAEERATGTLDLLLATPASHSAIVVAKYAATVTVVCLLLGLMLFCPLALSYFAAPDWGAIAAGMIGLGLFASALCALGIAISSLTSNQMIAAIVTLGLFLLLWMAEVLGVYLPSPLDDIALSLSLDNRLSPFVAGLIYASDVGFFISLSLVGIIVAVAALGRR